MIQEHVNTLTIAELRNALKSAGLQTGPITASTESVYRYSLLKYLIANESRHASPSTPKHTLQYVESSIHSDEGDDQEHDIDAGLLLALGQLIGESQPSDENIFSPVRWNPELQVYESLGSDVRSGSLANKRDEPRSAAGRWPIAFSVTILILAVVIAVTLLLLRDRDPYSALEQQASRAKMHAEGVVSADQ